MAWIEVQQSLPEHRKTLIAAELLGLQAEHLMGHLVRFWLWAVDNAINGDLGDVPTGVISRAAGWRGDAKEFVDALAIAKFLDGEPGHYVIHDYDEYLGKLIERREAAARRKKEWRDGRNADVTRDGTRDTEETDEGRDASVTTEPQPTLPNRTVPNQREKNPLTPIVMTEREHQVVEALRSVTGYPSDDARDLDLVRRMAADFPRVDLLAEARKWSTYKLDKPLERRSNARSQFRNWVQIGVDKGRAVLLSAALGRSNQSAPAEDRMAAWIKHQNELLDMRDPTTPEGGAPPNA